MHSLTQSPSKLTEGKKKKKKKKLNVVTNMELKYQHQKIICMSKSWVD